MPENGNRPAGAGRSGARKGKDEASKRARGNLHHSHRSGKSGMLRASKASSARLYAWETLDYIRKHGSYAHDSIDKIIGHSGLDEKDKAFATRLVLGVVSAEGTLDAVLDGCMNKPGDVKGDVRCALRISTYEMLFLDKPAHVAIHQGVELVGSFAPKAKGLANAVLRKVARASEDFPFGNPDSEPDAFAVSCGLPPWLVRYGIDCLGDKAARHMFSEGMEPASVFVYVNPIKLSDSEFLEAAGRAHIDVMPVKVYGRTIAGCYLLCDRRAVAKAEMLSLIENGCLLVSDASAQSVASFAAGAYVRACKDAGIAPADGAFLELCAGRATKTVMVQGDIYRAASVQSGGYAAVDNLGFKTSILEERCALYGVEVRDAITADATDLSTVLGNRRFHTVFIDAPCSGLGTMRRHPEIRWKATADTIVKSAQTGLSILKGAAEFVNRGGYIVYATCTFSREENEGVISAFLKSGEGASFRILPIGGKDRPFFTAADAPDAADSHFCAILKHI